MKIRRVVVVGTTGSGKTTLAERLAQILRVPHIELDALHWEPNWVPAPLEVFRARVQQVVSEEAWVVDGNYGKGRDLVWARAQMIVWLDYPLALVLWQLLKRTARRVRTKEELWSGNRERWQEHFGRDSLFIWAITSHASHRRYPDIARNEYPHLEFVRLRSPREAEAWLNRVKLQVVEGDETRGV